MLGVTSYQEALRSVGGHLDLEAGQAQYATGKLPAHLVLVEDPEQRCVTIAVGDFPRSLDAASLEALVLASRARRGSPGTGGGPLSDLLRAVGFALDQLHPTAVRITLRLSTLQLQIQDEHGTREVTYADDDLWALRRSAASRRTGRPLQRVTILRDETFNHTDADLLAPLAAEYAVEQVPLSYAPAVAESVQVPDLVVVQADVAVAEQVRQVLRRSPRMDRVPLMLLSTDSVPAPAGYDDMLLVPVPPARLRGRVRTILLRGAASGSFAAAPESAETGPVVRTATAMFTDLRGFTGLAERFADDPAGLLELLNVHLSAVVRAIAGCGGVIEKFLGDGVFATFGARDGLVPHRERALAAALEVVNANEALNCQNAERWGFRLEVGVGLATGKMVLGMIGPAERAELGILGDPINVASRLTALAKPGEVLFDESVYRMQDGRARADLLGHLAVRGREQGIVVYRVVPQEQAESNPTPNVITAVAA